MSGVSRVVPCGQTNGHEANSPFRKSAMALKKGSYCETISLQRFGNNVSFNKNSMLCFPELCFSLRLPQEIQGKSCNVRTSHAVWCLPSSVCPSMAEALFLRPLTQLYHSWSLAVKIHPQYWKIPFPMVCHSHRMQRIIYSGISPS